MRPTYDSPAVKSHRRLANSPPGALKKGVLTVKSSGCVRVTAPARAPSVAPQNKMMGARQTPLFDPLQCHEVRGEDVQNDQVFGEHGTFSDAKLCQARGDEDGQNCARRDCQRPSR
jgi:hypothetical protein